MSEANEQLIRDFFAYMSDEDFSTATAKYVSPNVSWWLIGWGEVADKLPEFAALFDQTLEDKRGLKMKIHSIMSDGDKVSAEAESYAKLKNGTIYNNFYHFLFEIRDGRIVRVKEYNDSKHVAEVFGPFLAGKA